MSRLSARTVVLGAAAIGALLLSACGGPSTPAPAPAASQAPSAQASAELAELLKIVPAPTFPGVSPRPPTGKSVALVSCTVPACQTSTSVIQPAAEALGWKYSFFGYDISKGPAAQNVALDQAMQAADPDYIVFAASHPQLTPAFLEKVKQRGTVLVGTSGLGTTPQYTCVGCVSKGENTGVLVQRLTQADQANPNVAYVTDPALTGVNKLIDGARTQAATGGGKVSVVNIAFAQPPAVNNQAVISYLQANPDTQYLVTVIQDPVAGLGVALKQAGLDKKVKLIMTNDVTTNPKASLDEIRSGRAFALVVNEFQMTNLRALDFFARSSVGKPDVALAEAAGWTQVITTANIDGVSQDLQAPNYLNTFYTAWGLG